MTDHEIKEEAYKLRTEASLLLATALGTGAARRFVDCVISAAILEIIVLNKEAMVTNKLEGTK